MALTICAGGSETMRPWLLNAALYVLQVGSAFADEKPAISAVVAAQALPSSLSAREIEIAELVAQGLRNREVADKLMISEWTVKNHVKNIYKKLSIDRRSELISLLN